MTLTPEAIARVAHEVNRAYCTTLGDFSQLPWEDAPVWQQDSALSGVEFHLRNPWAGPEASHANWHAEKWLAGWRDGPEKNTEAKTHPCMVPFFELAQRAADEGRSVRRRSARAGPAAGRRGEAAQSAREAAAVTNPTHQSVPPLAAE